MESKLENQDACEHPETSESHSGIEFCLYCGKEFDR